MTAITYEIKPRVVLAAPLEDGLENVVKRVHWTIEFTDGTHTSRGMGMTNFDSTDPSAFISADSLTAEQVAVWVYEREGGESFITGLMGPHSQVIARKQEEAAMNSLALPGMET